MPEVPVSSLDARAQKLVENARIALQRGNFDYVEEVTTQVLRQSPGCLPVRQLQHAARLRATAGHNRLWAKARGSIMQVRLGWGKNDAARQFARAERILATDPRHAGGWRGLAEAAAQLDLPETAVFAWEALRDERPQHRDTQLGLGAAYLAAGRAQDALATADALLRQQPQDGEALALMRQASVTLTLAEGKWEQEGSFRDKLREA